MAEYIEREAAIKRFNFAVLDCLGMEPTIRAGDIIKALESIPAADVQPAVKSHWIPPHDALAIIEEYGIPYWIPSEDCLPTIGEEIITLGPNGEMDCGHYKGLSDTRRDKWNWKQHTVKTVKYWLPRKSLPQPPKEET